MQHFWEPREIFAVSLFLDLLILPRGRVCYRHFWRRHQSETENLTIGITTFYMQTHWLQRKALTYTPGRKHWRQLCSPNIFENPWKYFRYLCSSTFLFYLGEGYVMVIILAASTEGHIKVKRSIWGSHRDILHVNTVTRHTPGSKHWRQLWWVQTQTRANALALAYSIYSYHITCLLFPQRPARKHIASEFVVLSSGKSRNWPFHHNCVISNW